nr:FAD-binding oxidoreductase [uncultured Brevundimonas sp.]
MTVLAPKSVAVIGGGLVGVASALRLKRAGLEVTLIDTGDVRRGASFGNIGHIAAEQCEPLASPQSLLTAFGRLFAWGGPLDFRWRDATLWGPWAARFASASRRASFDRGAQALGALLVDPLGDWADLLDLAGAEPDLVRAEGHAVVWMGSEAGQTGVDAWRHARIGTTHFRLMEAEERRVYGGVLNSIPATGLRFDGTGQVREPQAVREALGTAFRSAGGVEVAGCASAIVDDDTRARVETNDGQVVEADALLVAAGAWSAPLMRGLGVEAPLIGERGYSIQSVRHDWPQELPLTVFQERSMVAARFAGGLRIAGHVEFGAPDAPADPRKWRRLERHAQDLGLRLDPAADRWSGPRPTLPDYLPAIGRLERSPRVFYAFGHQHLGLTLAATTALLVEDLILGRPTAIDVAPFGLERFQR